jgi:hypothetical protein
MCFGDGHLLIMAIGLPITLGIFLTGNMGSGVRVYQLGQGFNVSELLRGKIISYRIHYIIADNLEKVILE